MPAMLFPFPNFSLAFYYYKGTFSSLFKGSILINGQWRSSRYKKKMTLMPSTIHEKWKTIAPLNKQMSNLRMSFFKQTSQNKVYLSKVIVGTTNIDHSPLTYTFPVQKDTLFKTLIIKSEIVCPVETQGSENHILFRDT